MSQNSYFYFTFQFSSIVKTQKCHLHKCEEKQGMLISLAASFLVLTLMAAILVLQRGTPIWQMHSGSWNFPKTYFPRNLWSEEYYRPRNCCRCLFLPFVSECCSCKQTCFIVMITTKYRYTGNEKKWSNRLTSWRTCCDEQAGLPPHQYHCHLKMTHPHCCPNQYYHHRHPRLHLQPKQRTNYHTAESLFKNYLLSVDINSTSCETGSSSLTRKMDLPFPKNSTFNLAFWHSGIFILLEFWPKA